MNTFSDKKEAVQIYTNMLIKRNRSFCPETDRILHLKEFYWYMLHADWDLLGKTKVEDSYLFHLVLKDTRPGYTGYTRQGKVFVLMPESTSSV